MSDENFMKDINWLNFLKLRASWGQLGNHRIADFMYLPLISLGQNYAFGGASATGAAQTTANNPDITWETTTEKNIGIDLKLLKNRISVSIDAYDRYTDDILTVIPVSGTFGLPAPTVNYGAMSNKGIETEMRYSKMKGEFQFDVSLNGSYNTTKVLSLLTNTPGERITVGTHVFNGELRQVVGQEMGQIYGFGYRRDANGKRVFGANGIALRTPDLISFGSAIPKYVGGITNTFNYKGISLSALIDFKVGNMMLSGTNFNAVRHGLHKMTLEGREGGVVADGVNAQGGPNTAKAGVQPFWEVVRSQALIEPVVYDGSYWKLRQITAGYDFTKHLSPKSPIKGIKLSFVANNVLILKKYIDNIDPESFGYSSDNLVGMESTGLPTTRSLGFNLNVKF
jgi:outer membrane receptor protein involved in Fe transport